MFLSLAAAFASFIIYFLTKAPTTSFWDCGEFIASAYIMGIPHPPGYPMYIILGRLFSLLPIASDIAVRINILSVIGAAASVYVSFWLIVFVANGSSKENPSGMLSRIGIGIGAFSGAIIMGFSYTFWSSAVEAEVYSLSMLIMLLMNLLAFVWVRDYEKPGNDRKLILISFLLWLSLGIHMTTFIIIIPVLGYLIYYDYVKNNLARWPVWLALGLAILYAIPLQTSLLGFVGIDISNYELESFIVIFLSMFLIIAVKSWFARARKSKSARAWITALLIMAFAIIGFSPQLYIPIRAAKKPMINENDPSNWSRFKGFLERKQYQQQSMIERMFKRRGSWKNQLVSDRRFGLLYYFERQFASPDTKVTFWETNVNNGSSGGLSLKLPMLYIIIIGLWGIYESIKRGPPEGIFMLSAFLLCTIGLAVYMNFSDGTFNPRIAPIPEVRIRDYFYTPGFMYYGIIIGIGITLALKWLSSLLETGNKNQWYYRAAFIISAFGAVALSANTVYANYAQNDRSDNYLPVDYAKNILSSCKENGILFTNGDNDTFPLWYIQEVEGFRKDVRVVNLSLLNASWYIHQLKDQMSVPISMNYDDIENIRPVRLARYNKILRVQDLMVQEIVSNIQKDGWKIPVYFAITVSGGNRMGLDDNLVMEGMAFRITPTTGKDRVDTEIGMRIFGNPDNFRGMGDPKKNINENDLKLVSNYMVSMFKVAEALAREDKLDSAVEMAKTAINMQGDNPIWQSKVYLAKIYAQAGLLDSVAQLVLGDENGEKIYLAAGQDRIEAQDYETAINILQRSVSVYKSSFASLNNLAILYRKEGKEHMLDSLVNNFAEYNADNPQLMASLDQLKKKLENILPEPGTIN